LPTRQCRAGAGDALSLIGHTWVVQYIISAKSNEFGSTEPPLPAHIEATIRLITRLHAEHHRNATPVQRAVDRITALVGRPRFLGVLAVIVAGWISLNLLVGALGYRPIDPPPFSGLEVAVSLTSLFMAILILATQRREVQLTQLRE
jgi:uncharacterized membrane protein